VTVKAFVRRTLLILFGLLLLGGLVYSFMPRPVAVDLTTARRGDLRVTVDEDGKTRVKDRYEVSSPLNARLERIGLRAGDPVEAGKTVLAVLTPADPALLDARARAETEARIQSALSSRKRANAQVDRAQTLLDQVKNELTRSRRIPVGKGITQQELDDLMFKEKAYEKELRSAEFALHVAEFELDLAKAALVRIQPISPGDPEPQRLDVRSPITGRVLKVHQESSANVTPGQKLLDLGDPGELEMEIDVLSADAVKIKPGAKVIVEQWGGEYPLGGRVRRVEPSGFTKTSALGVEEQRVWVIIDFDDPPEKRLSLGDGYRVEVRIIIWEGKNVLKVPSGALFPHGPGKAVFVVEDGQAVMRPVEVGRSNGIETQVVSGVREGEQVILHPSDKIKAGAAVVPR
jgi:HlyD family secretion protein